MKLLNLSTVTIILFITKVKADSGQEIYCGRRLKRHEGLLANRGDASEGDWPWHAAIYHLGKNTENQYKCAGTLINSNSILTAAHCVHENDQLIIAQLIWVNLGQISLKFLGSNTQQFYVHNVIPHPYYGSDYSNDIAIIRLATEAKFNNYVQPICLWESTKLDISEIIGRLGTVVGWGITENYTISYTLQQTFMPVQAHLTCLASNRDFFGNFLSEKNFCAGFRNGTSVCQGDSGGSMVFEENGVYRIRGIFSKVYKRIGFDKSFCSAMSYVIFTDVAKHLTWIEEVVSQLPLPYLGVGTSGGAPSSKLSPAPPGGGSGSSSNLLPAPGGGGSASNLLPAPLVCGRAWYSDRIDGITRINEYPWMALMEYSKPNNGRGFHCGGALISERYVLTSASCAVSTEFKQLKWNLSSVRLGEWDTNSDIDCDRGECSDPPIDVPVEEIIAHEEYNPLSKERNNDIALLRLSRSVTYTDFIQPICLPTSETLRKINYDDIDLELVGWGKTERASFSNYKQKAEVPGVGFQQCKSIYRGFGATISAGQFCAGEDKGVDSCIGDSGGPLVAIDRSNPMRPYYYCAGIKSFGPTPCGLERLPIIYTRVSAYTDWILRNVRV